MSDNSVEPICAKAVTEQAACWIERKTRNDWSDEDESALERWLAEAPSHRIAYWRLDGAWDETYRLAALRKVGEPTLVSGPSRRFWSLLARSIAVTATISVAGIIIAYYFNGPAEVYSTDLGVRKTLTLSDGSQIELNTQTTIRAELNKGTRNVWLESGEAYFRIKHDTAHPFTVFVAGRRITDLGTEFSVRKNSERLQVAVVRGKVSLEREGDSSRTDLLPGDIAIADAHALHLTHIPMIELANKLSWRHGKLMFHHAPLGDVVDEFNRYNSQKLTVSGDGARSVTINGTFATNDAHAFARIAQTILGLRVEDRGDEIVISQ